MVSKKILGVAIAAALSAPAFAVVDLTGGTNGAGSGAVLYAKESVLSSQVSNGLVQVTAATPSTYGPLVVGSAELDVEVATGFGVTATTHAFIRFNLTNAKFKNAVLASHLTAVSGTISNVTVAQGGAVGDDYVILDVTSGGLAQTDKLRLSLNGLQVSPTAAATISYAHYSTSPNAVGQSGALATDSYAFVSVANALTTTISKTDRVANVSTTPTAFTQFITPASAIASIGNIKFELAAGALSPVGAAVTTLAQVMDTAAGKSQVQITSGDLSFISGANAAATALNLTFGGVAADVATPGTNTASTGKLTQLSGLALAGAGNDVVLSATSAINAGTYTLAFTPTAITNAQYGAASATGSLGEITRSGTTIQVPYLTTYADYNQRLVLVNRGASSAPYSISFTKEAGVTAVAGTAATGTLAANETKIIKASDIVTLTGATRTAATVVITAPSTTIDAATTTVNLSDKSTDTVKLQ